VPYFNRMTMPVGLALLFLMAVAPVLPWRKASTELLSQRLFWPACAGVAAVALAVVLGARGLAPLVAFGLAAFAAGSAVRQVVLATRRQGWRGLVGRANGGMVVHIGVVVIAVALAASSSYDREQEVTLAVGDTASLAGHELTYVGNRTIEADNKTSVRAQIRVDGQVYEPAINTFRGSEQAIGTPSVATGFRQDVFLSLVRAPEGDEGQTIGLLVVVQPLVSWLWVGGLIMALGTMLAAFPGRRRNPIDPVSAPVTVTGTPAQVPPPAEPEPEPEPVEVGS